LGTDGKYGRVSTEHGDIPDDEPVIVVRARDKNSAPLISAYWELCKRGGSPQFHLDLVEQTYKRFTDWQEAHPDQVRTPDSEAYRQRLM
jgi:hypothetical protein